jgi:transcriptional regulator with XRE-family HTH domain
MKLTHFRRFAFLDVEADSVSVINISIALRGQVERLEPVCGVDKKKLIGQRVRAARVERGLTQERLAELLDRSVDTVSNLERGVSLPAHATLERLCQALDLRLDELLGPLPPGQVTDEKSAALLYRIYELAKRLDRADLQLAYGILKIIASRPK